jgi:hypothetical protein
VLIKDGRPVPALGHRHRVRAKQRQRLVEHEAPALGPYRRGGGDDVDLARLLIAQQRHEVVNGGVPRGQQVTGDSSHE